MVVPLVAGYVTRRVLLSRGEDRQRIDSFSAKLKPYTVTGLLATVVLLFAFQGPRILEQPLLIALIAAPLLVQSYGIFLIHPLLMTAFGVTLFRLTSNDWVATILLFATVLPLTSFLAYLSFRYFETPTNTWLRKAFHLSKLPPKSVQGKAATMRPTVV